MLMNPYRNCIVMGEKFDASLEDISGYLDELDEERVRLELKEAVEKLEEDAEKAATHVRRAIALLADD
jgi:hypothetical protein